METSVSPLAEEKVTSGAPVLEKGKSQGKKGLPGPPALFPGPWCVPQDHQADATPEDTFTVCCAGNKYKFVTGAQLAGRRRAPL